MDERICFEGISHSVDDPHIDEGSNACNNSHKCDGLRMGKDWSIGNGSHICDGFRIDDDSCIGDSSRKDDDSHIGDSSHTGDNLSKGNDSRMGNDPHIYNDLRMGNDPHIYNDLRMGNDSRIKVCIFDLDGTLARTQESIARPVNMTLAYFGLPEQPVEAFNYFAGDGIKNALKRALIASGDANASHLEEGLPMCRAWMQEDPAFHVEPYDNIVWALEKLKAKGVKIAVFSNKPHESAVGVVETVFGKGFFDHIQGQTDRIPIKPDPAGLFEILDKYGAKKEECLYFGDTNTDMMTGHNAGVTTVGVTWGFRPRAELEDNNADIIIDNASEIPGLAGMDV